MRHCTAQHKSKLSLKLIPLYKAVYQMHSASSELSCQKDLFSLPPDIHYLNCAYMSPLSKRVEAAGIAGVLRKSNPTGVDPSDFFTESNEVRALFARLVNAPAERIAFIPAASYGIATAAKNLKGEKGQNIVVLDEQFPSNVYSWRNFKTKGLELRTVTPPSGIHRGEGWNARILEAIDTSTAVVALGHVHWTDGTLFDLEAIGKRSREVGAALIIDATQSVGALPFDVAKLQPDALIVAGYKTLMGPYSIGCAYYSSRFDNGHPLEDNWITRKDSENFSGLVDYKDEYSVGMTRYDVGERSNFTLMPMFKAAIEDVLERQPARIQRYCARLTKGLIETLDNLGYQVEAADYRARHLFGIRLPKHVDLESLKTRLMERKIYASVRGTALRVSSNVYNDEADIAALQGVLKELAA